MSFVNINSEPAAGLCGLACRASPPHTHRRSEARSMSAPTVAQGGGG